MEINYEETKSPNERNSAENVYDQEATQLLQEVMDNYNDIFEDEEEKKELPSTLRIDGKISITLETSNPCISSRTNKDSAKVKNRGFGNLLSSDTLSSSKEIYGNRLFATIISYLYHLNSNQSSED